jgi:hypothetical protein
MTPINLKPRQSGGSGGLWGKIIGGIAGAVAAPFTAGASLAAVPALMGAGSAIGGMVGSAVDPGKISGGGGVQSTESGVKATPLDTTAMLDPEVQQATVLDSKKALWGEPSIPMAEKQRYSDVLDQTHSALEEMKRRSGGFSYDQS